MGKLNNYIGGTVAVTTCLAVAGLAGMLFVFTFLDQLTDIKNDYTMVKAAWFVLLSTPRMLYETIPYAALIGCLAGLGLLAGSSEITVMRSAGVSTWRIAGSAMLPALILTFIGLAMGEYALPDFERKARMLRQDARENQIAEGFWYREQNTFMHFGGISGQGEIRNLNQYVLNADRELVKSLHADTAIFVAEDYPLHLWRLQDVTVTKLNNAPETTQLSAMEWRTALTPETLTAEILVAPERMSMQQLREKITLTRAQGLNADKLELGLWRKLFQPLDCLALVFVGVSFIFGPLRTTSTGTRVMAGILVGLVFRFAQDLFAPASLVFGFAPVWAGLVPIFVCLGTGYLLLKRAN